MDIEYKYPVTIVCYVVLMPNKRKNINKLLALVISILYFPMITFYNSQKYCLAYSFSIQYIFPSITPPPILYYCPSIVYTFVKSYLSKTYTILH